MKIENKLEEDNKSKINKTIFRFLDDTKSVESMLSKINYKQDYKKVLEDVNNELKNKIIKDSDDSIYYNIVFDENGSLELNYIEFDGDGPQISFNIDNDDLYDIQDEEFDSINLKGRIVELKTKKGIVYEYDIDKDELKLTYDPTK